MAGFTPRQREEKACPLVHLALGPDPAAVLGDDALDDGEPDAGAGAGAFKLVHAVQALEHAIQLGGVATSPQPHFNTSRLRSCRAIPIIHT